MYDGFSTGREDDADREVMLCGVNELGRQIVMTVGGFAAQQLAVPSPLEGEGLGGQDARIGQLSWRQCFAV